MKELRDILAIAFLAAIPIAASSAWHFLLTTRRLKNIDNPRESWREQFDVKGGAQ